MKKQYIYAAAVIHAKENELLNKEIFEELIKIGTQEEAMAWLEEKGYDIMSAKSIEEVLMRERVRVREVVKELFGEVPELNLFLCETDFQNLKSAVKAVVCNQTSGFFVEGGSVLVETFEKAVNARDFKELPKNLKIAAEKALKMFEKTFDMGLCESVIDRIYLETIRDISKDSDNLALKKYISLYVDLKNIFIAARGAKLNKNLEFFEVSLTGCDGFSKSSLSEVSVKGYDELLGFLSATKYKEAASKLAISFAEFERWMDDSLIQEIKKTGTDYFGAGAAFAYIVSKERELFNIKLVLTVVLNGIETRVCKERLRMLYV